MAKSVKFSAVTGGQAPYQYILSPLGQASEDTFANVPTGMFRGKVVDALGKTTLPKLKYVSDPTHITDRKLNWDKIPAFQLPSGMIGVCGWGFPRWLDEAQPSDALIRGWTHTDNNLIDGAELVNAKRVRTIYFPFGGYSAFQDAINEVKNSFPNAINATVIQHWTLSNPTGNAISGSYVGATGATVQFTISAGNVLELDALFGTEPTYSLSSKNQGIIRFNNPDAVDAPTGVAIGRAYYNQEKWSPDGTTNNPIAFRTGLLFWNEETLGNANTLTQFVFKGMSLEAQAQGNPFKIIYYGKDFIGFGGGFYSGQQNDNVSWKLKVFPNLSPAIRITAEVLSRYADRAEIGEANCVYLDNGTYYKVPYPLINTKYEKQNGAFIIDQDGERKFRIGEFSETIRGKSVKFLNDTINGFWVGADPSYGYPNNRVSEMYWAITQFYAATTKMLYSNIALAQKYRNNKDIYTEFTDIPVKNCAVVRDVTEGTGPGYDIIDRPIVSYQIEFSVLMTYATCETFCIWTDYGVVAHPNFPNNLPVAKNKNQGYAIITDKTGNTPIEFSQFEDMTWALKIVADAHAQHGVFGVGNKKIVAYEPANTTHEIIILGRIKSNKLWIFASEPRLDPNESIVVTVTTKKNNYTQQFLVKGCENFVDTFVLPATDSYEPADIVFSYKDIYTVQHSVSGDLRQHLVNAVPTVVPTDGVSVFEFFPKMNSNQYPSGNQGNDYIKFQFASWSIISSNADLTPTTVQSHVDCKLYDDSNNLVCNIIDKRGNYHPNFIPKFPQGTDLRSNNHLSQYAKYLPFGRYKIIVKNISVSDVTMKMRLGWAGIGGTVMELLNDELLTKGSTRTLEFNIGNTWVDDDGVQHNYLDGSNQMILNFNVYNYP